MSKLSSSLCPSHNGCDYVNNERKISCNGTLADVENKIFVEIVEICNLDFPVLDLDRIIADFPHIVSLRINESNINVITKGPRHQYTLKVSVDIIFFRVTDKCLQELALTNMFLGNVENNVFANFKNLQKLDLRKNNISTFPNMLQLNNISEMYFSGEYINTVS